MKKTFIQVGALLFVLILQSMFLSAQDYRTVHFDREGYFESEEFGMGIDYQYSPCSPCQFGIRVEDVVEDSTKYIFPIYWNTETGDLEPRASWLGDTLTFLSDGTELYRNKNGSHITIIPHTEEGGVWTMFDLGSGSYLEASVIEKSHENILGSLDSVKTIVIQAKASSGTNLDHDMNGFTFKIGKESGFIEVFDVFHFPTRMPKIYLTGLSNPIVGEGILDAKSIYDYQIGDERIIVDDLDYMNLIYYKYLVLEREDIGSDSVQYLFEVQKAEMISTYNPSTGFYDTHYEFFQWEWSKTYYIGNDSNLNIHPYEKDDNVFEGHFNYISKNQEGKWFKVFYAAVNLSYHYRFEYLDCLGNSVKEYGETLAPEISERLVYYKKGNEEWGTYINLEGLVSTKNIRDPENTITVYPNPSTNNIAITTEDQNTKLHHIQVLNNLGQTVADWPCPDQSELTKSVAHFPKGVYWLIITDEDGRLWRERFLKD